jgi:hypothetical protein
MFFSVRAPSRLLWLLLAGLVVALGSVSARADDIKLRIASGHPAVNTYVNLMQSFFVPEVTKRVAERTKHKVEFIEGYGGSMVKVADTLEVCSRASSTWAATASASSRPTCRCTPSRSCCRSAP